MNTPTPTPTPVTFAAMIMTDGKRTVNGIYRGLLLAPGTDRRHIKFTDNTFAQIATEESNSGDHLADVDRLALKYATPDFPAVNHRLEVV